MSLNINQKLYDLQTEKSVLGILLLHAKDNILAQIREAEFNPDYFFDQFHRKVATGIKSLVAKEITIDSLQVAAECGVEVHNLYELIPASSWCSNTEEALNLIKKYYQKRKIQDILATAFYKIEEEEPTDLILELQKNLQDLDCDKTTGIYKLYDAILLNEEQQLAEYEQNKGSRNLVTNIEQVDKLIKKIKPNSLVTVAAATESGKTSLGIQIFTNLWFKQNKKGMFFSLEMTSTEITRRMLSILSGIDFDLVDDWYSDWVCQKKDALGLGEIYDQAMLKTKEAELYLTDSIFTLADIENSFKKFHLKNPVDFIVVDYIQLVDNKKSNGRSERHLEVAEISRVMQRIAKKYNITVFQLSQLNDEGLVADSRSIKKDSDMMLKLERNKENGVTQITLDKDRAGGDYGKITLDFNKKTKTFQ